MDLFKQLTEQQGELSLPLLVVNLLVCAGLAALLRLHYIKFGRALANREEFARNFLTISLATTLIITIVKGSLTLSLGLVGALSIVRFRTPIKDPEELCYLFLSVGVGIGLGANQVLPTLLATIVILAILSLRAGVGTEAPAALYLEVDIPEGVESAASLEQLSGLLQAKLAQVRLRRADFQGSALLAAFAIRHDEPTTLGGLTDEICQVWPAARVTLLDTDQLLDA